MKLYYAQYSRAVRVAWLLEELELLYEIETFSIGSNHYLIVTKNDEVLIYDRKTNILKQRIKIK